MEMKELVIDTLKKLIPERNSIGQIFPEMDLKEDLGLDSIKVLRLIIELERAIETDFILTSPDLDLMGVRTVHDIVTILNKVNDAK
jgi:acyl carrier protein